MTKYFYNITMRDYATRQASRCLVNLAGMNKSDYDKVITEQESLRFWKNAISNYEQRLDEMSIENCESPIDEFELDYLLRHVSMLIDNREGETARVILNSLNKLAA